jgi:tRNA-specific 2-thiouridylase
MAQARSVAQQLGIPFYAVDVRDRFRETVVQSFIQGYRNGQTPNPCVVCNRQIRWGALYEQARSSGADFLATGHYAQISRTEGESDQLLKGNDSGKDQSYVLSVLSQEQLKHSLFPVGEYPKAQVRELAQKYNLAVASRPDSQDLCFLAGQDYRDFLKRYAPESIRPGLIQRPDGVVLGEHQGLAFYTIGQRKGLGLSSPEPLYVIRKDAEKNVLIIGNGAALGSSELLAGDVNWLDGSPPAMEFDAGVKIRYKAREVLARISITQDDRVRVKFKQPLRDITPGQRAVFYQGNVCLGGGMILSGEENE